MSKTFQVTVPDEAFEEIKRLMDITGHERPGALFALLVRRYGKDLARCLSDYVPPTPDIVPPTSTYAVPAKQHNVSLKSDYVPPEPDIVPPRQEVLTLKDRMNLLANPSKQQEEL